MFSLETQCDKLNLSQVGCNAYLYSIKVGKLVEAVLPCNIAHSLKIQHCLAFVVYMYVASPNHLISFTFETNNYLNLLGDKNIYTVFVFWEERYNVF